MKRTLPLFLVFAMLSSLLCGCGAAGKQSAALSPGNTEDALRQIEAMGQPVDDNYRVWYEVFVYAYCDSDGDGIGDLQGLRQKLPEITALGATGIWLMPIHPSRSYHKYDVSDYYAIDPQYGTMDDFDGFLADCKKAGIHVILDLVLNHTGSDHPWFTEAASYVSSLAQGEEPDVSKCPYVDYYFFSREQQAGYNQVQGTDWYYESCFSPDMPDLNLANPKVREEIRRIMEFWLGKGVDGFRLDAAKEYYSGETERNVEVLSFLQQTAVSIKSDAYMVAEVWDSFSRITDFYKSGITSIFNFPFANSSGIIVKTLRRAGDPSAVESYAVSLEQADAAYRESNPGYIDAPFLSNHDIGRIAGFASRDPDRMKLAAAMNLLMGGSAFVYYGEEIGMPGSGNDPSKRAPMLWNAERTDGVCKPCPGCELPDEYPLGSLEQQRDDDESLYNYYRRAIAIRNALPVISHGTVTAEKALNQDCISAQRKTYGDRQCIILMNISSEAATADLTEYKDWKLSASLLTGQDSAVLKDGKLTMPPYAVTVLTPKQ